MKTQPTVAIPSFGRRRIARRLVIATIIFSSFITLLTTSYQLYADYRHDLKTIHGYFTLIENSYIESLSTSVWMYDSRQIATQLDGLIKLPDMEYLEIQAGKDYTWSTGTPRSSRTLVREFPLTFRHRGETFPIGTLKATVSLDNVYDRLIGRTLTILLMNGIRAFFVSGFILLVFQHFVTRHLVELAGHVKNFDLSRAPEKISLKRKKRLPKNDEIDQVVDAINHMQTTLYQSYAALKNSEMEHRRAVQRIEHLNRVLRAIRDVDQLIAHERDRDAFIRMACRLLVDSRGYASALIILTDQDNRPASWAETGLDAVYVTLAAMLEKGEIPPCCSCVRSDDEVFLIDQRQEVCRQCPVADAYRVLDALCARLTHDGTSFGYLIVSLERGLAAEAEERALFLEMTGDLAYALYVLQMDEARKESERQREALEVQLFQVQKLESVGRLAGGVAHDYNNMLSVIIGFAELGLEKVEANDPLYTNFEEILLAANRSKEITRQLLAFARQQTIAPKVLDLNATVESMLKMLRHLIGEDIDLAWRPKADLWPVKVDPTQIDQILANLCVNARDAIADVGKITIETDMATFDGAYCAQHAGFVPGDFVILAVSDDGSGIDKETLNNIFEPFFTTKGVGQGTGLGLATVYGIVRQNEGFINVYSEPDNGTTFKIYLRRHASQTGEALLPGTEKIPMGRGEIVLVVEDESLILKLAGRMLTALGYRSLLAKNPDEALKLAELHSDEISLLLTDVVMPAMNGRELADRLKAIRPNLRCLFMSGYTANVIAHRGILDEGVHFIQKPFSKDQLAIKIISVLQAKNI